MQKMLYIAISLFIVMNPIGSSSLFLSLLKGIPKKRQLQIVFRELLIALFVIIIFNYIGQILLSFLNITQEVVQVAGGVVLFLLSIKMLFPPPEEAKHTEEAELKKIKEPFIVPLAIPLIAGPAVLAMVMLFSQQQPSNVIMIGAIFISWLASLIILLLSAQLSEWLGERGILATERLMGFIMVLISIQMFLSGIKTFMK
ncbi:MAG: NAAT family transporter [Parachlamydiales bacterium]|nr:NAAT family transporter [Parachlamydiales bacterium]